MRWSDAARPPTRVQLRQFAGLWLLFVVVIAGRQYWYGTLGSTGARIALAFGALGVAGVAWPPIMRWIYTSWMIAVFPIGWAVSRVVLGAMYFGMFTPIAVLFRIIGRDALVLRRKKTDSYWLVREPAPPPADYLRQS